MSGMPFGRGGACAVQLLYSPDLAILSGMTNSVAWPSQEQDRTLRHRCNAFTFPLRLSPSLPFCFWGRWCIVMTVRAWLAAYAAFALALLLPFWSFCSDRTNVSIHYFCTRLPRTRLIDMYYSDNRLSLYTDEHAPSYFCFRIFFC